MWQKDLNPNRVVKIKYVWLTRKGLNPQAWNFKVIGIAAGGTCSSSCIRIIIYVGYRSKRPKIKIILISHFLLLSSIPNKLCIGAVEFAEFLSIPHLHTNDRWSIKYEWISSWTIQRPDSNPLGLKNKQKRNKLPPKNHHPNRYQTAPPQAPINSQYPTYFPFHYCESSPVKSPKVFKNPNSYDAKFDTHLRTHQLTIKPAIWSPAPEPC